MCSTNVIVAHSKIISQLNIPTHTPFTPPTRSEEEEESEEDESSEDESLVDSDEDDEEGSDFDEEEEEGEAMRYWSGVCSWCHISCITVL